MLGEENLLPSGGESDDHREALPADAPLKGI